jgi:hypothetical protein
VNYAGQGPNYTVKRIIEESSLIGTYKNTHEVIARNFALPKTSVLHADLNMEKTLDNLHHYIADHSPHTFMLRRQAVYLIPDMMDKGHGMMTNGHARTAEDTEHEHGNDDDDGPDADDIIDEL